MRLAIEQWRVGSPSSGLQTGRDFEVATGGHSYSIRRQLVCVAAIASFKFRYGSWLCENALAGALTPCNWEASSKCKRFFSGARLCPDCRHEQLNAEDVHNAREIVGQYVQGHLGGDSRQRLHQKVRCTHPHLERGKGVFSCLATHAHRLRVLIETLLHGFEQ